LQGATKKQIICRGLNTYGWKCPPYTRVLLRPNYSAVVTKNDQLHPLFVTGLSDAVVFILVLQKNRAVKQVGKSKFVFLLVSIKEIAPC
jgi:hypothetical protein